VNPRRRDDRPFLEKIAAENRGKCRDDIEDSKSARIL
jgi:hypothetical protein